MKTPFAMTRSVWKGPFLDHALWKKPLTARTTIWSRRSLILPQFVGHTVRVHNGKGFIRLVIAEEMIGHKFGEFAMTRKRAIHKKKVKKKK